jgi:hypothetical protein
MQEENVFHLLKTWDGCIFLLHSCKLFFAPTCLASNVQFVGGSEYDLLNHIRTFFSSCASAWLHQYASVHSAHWCALEI